MEQPKPKVIETMRETLQADIELQEEELIGHSRTLEGIRETLLKEVNVQEEVRALFNKILHRLSFIYISVGVLLLLSIGIVIYMINLPMSSVNLAMKQVEELQKNIIIQRTFVQMDRRDAAEARLQLTHLINLQDSLQHFQDSVLNKKLIKEIKKALQ